VSSVCFNRASSLVRSQIVKPGSSDECTQGHNRDSLVNIATGHRLNSQCSIFDRCDFYIHHIDQTGSGAHPAFCPMGKGSKAAGA
jgi:hypothetical protein